MDAKMLKAQLTELCQCGHPFIDHRRGFALGLETYHCDCGCPEYSKAKHGNAATRKLTKDFVYRCGKCGRLHDGGGNEYPEALCEDCARL
jgi:hypothetical protein